MVRRNRNNRPAFASTSSVLKLCSSAAIIAPAPPSKPNAAAPTIASVQARPMMTFTSKRRAAAAAQAHARAEPTQIAADQDDVRRRERDVGRAAAHRDTDDAGFQRERIVDAVADDHRSKALRDFLAYVLELLVRQRFGAHIRDAYLACERRARRSLDRRSATSVASIPTRASPASASCASGRNVSASNNHATNITVERQPCDRAVVMRDR